MAKGKEIYKQWWFWLILVILIIGLWRWSKRGWTIGYIPLLGLRKRSNNEISNTSMQVQVPSQTVITSGCGGRTQMPSVVAYT